MRKLYKIVNIALIFMLEAVFSSSDLAYSTDVSTLRIPLGIYRDRKGAVLNRFFRERKLLIKNYTLPNQYRDLTIGMVQLDISPYVIKKGELLGNIVQKISKYMAYTHRVLKDFLSVIKPSYLIIMSNGKVVKFVKNYFWQEERIFELKGNKIGVAICYEFLDQGLIDKLKKSNPDIVIVPANTPGVKRLQKKALSQRLEAFLVNSISSSVIGGSSGAIGEHRGPSLGKDECIGIVGFNKNRNKPANSDIARETSVRIPRNVFDFGKRFIAKSRIYLRSCL